jgi:CheY-like chemotaxis protein
MQPEPARSAAAMIEPAMVTEVVPQRSETILLVEDALRVRAVVREILEMNGYNVLEARHGAEALEISERHQGPIHLMVTDVVMPQMSGRELAQRLQPIRQDMRVLYMSGYTDDAIVRHGVLGAGMAFLSKPFTPDALALKVREVLDTPPRSVDPNAPHATPPVNGKGAGAIATDLKDDEGRPLPATSLAEPWTFRGGATPQDVYLRFRTGMNGTPMPSFVDAATDGDLRNLAAYVLTLARKPVWDMDAAELTAFYQAQAAEAARDPVRRGRYLVQSIGCTFCHTPVRADGSLVDGMLFAGGQRWRAVPFGDFVSYNLTSDKETGLGGWTDDQIKTLVTRGVRRDGSRMIPFPMPWISYANLTPADVSAIVAYLRTIPPITNRIPAPTRPNIVSYLWGKFQLLILKKDLPLLAFPGNAGSGGLPAEVPTKAGGA